MKIRKKSCLWGILFVLALMVACSLPANSTQTQIWTISSFDEFRQGESENISLTGTGELGLAPQSDQLLTLKGQDLFVWALSADSTGNLYAATGEQGRIFKITPEGQVSLFFDSPEINILSLAVDAGNNVYAGSAPDGLIYRITPEGNQTVFFSTEEHYVWALVSDQDHILYAATGESGKIFKINPDGAGTVLYDSPDAHVMSLVYDPKGWFYAGTEGQGITYKIGLDGSAFALYNAEEEEVHSLTLDSQGNLYIAAISNKFYPKMQAPAPTTEQRRAPEEKGLKKSSIYRIHAGGSVTKILEMPDILIYAIIVDGQDQLLVGTDEQGTLYRVLPDGESHQVLKLDPGNILSLLRTPNGNIYAGTGDTGGVYRLSAQPAHQGSYLSSVYDVKTTATWGKIFWRGTPDQIVLLTRTGNTIRPDDTWSPWSAELQHQEGSPVLNPPARFIQWKAILTAREQRSPILEEVSVAYLPHNLAPEIIKIGIFYAGPEEQPGQRNIPSHPSAPNSASRPPQAEARKQEKALKPPKLIPPGYLGIVWEAEDPNGEDLLYTISLRGEQETSWKVIAEDLAETEYLLDTFTLPDGAYYIRITATDAPNNPPNRALIAEKVSERLEIDNSAPKISLALNQTQTDIMTFVTVIASDELSHLKSAEYSIDAGEWVAIFPDDEVTDSREEQYSIQLSNLSPKEHTLIFRATDLYNNIGVGKIRIPALATP